LPPDRLAAVVRGDAAPLVNVGCGNDLTIRELGELIRDVVGTNAMIDWDTSKPDGTPQKRLDVSKLHALGWRQTVPLEEGIRRAHADFVARFG